jgi:hypothetical protein
MFLGVHGEPDDSVKPGKVSSLSASGSAAVGHLGEISEKERRSTCGREIQNLCSLNTYELKFKVDEEQQCIYSKTFL